MTAPRGGPEPDAAGEALRFPFGPPPPAATEAGAREYYALLDLVKEFDRNLLVVKGWGATVSTVTLAAGFQTGHFGIFLVAALAGLAFWTLDAAMKRHQMRHYVRMREIEWQCAALLGPDSGGQSTPQIDWSWTLAPPYLARAAGGAPPPPERYGRGPGEGQHQASPLRLYWLYPHVALPHAIADASGGALFALGAAGRLAFPL